MTTQTAILGGGCFWCLEAVYQRLKGVSAVASGYMGGQVPSPSYEQVCTKRTGHAEVVRLAFDPGVIRYGQLLDVFFTIHDPTTKDRQGNDVGPQYRSVIFAMDGEQLSQAQQKINSLASAFPSPIVTELVAAFDASGAVGSAVETTFWPAESEHENYFRNHPSQPYCALVVSPKVQKAVQKFRDLLA